jgi:hypothetical protein
MAAIDHGGFAKILKYLPRNRTVSGKSDKHALHITTAYYELERERMARQWDEQERFYAIEALNAVITPKEDSYDAYEEAINYTEAKPKVASKAAKSNSAKHWYMWKK